MQEQAATPRHQRRTCGRKETHFTGPRGRGEATAGAVNPEGAFLSGRLRSRAEAGPREGDGKRREAGSWGWHPASSILAASGGVGGLPRPRTGPAGTGARHSPYPRLLPRAAAVPMAVAGSLSKGPTAFTSWRRSPKGQAPPGYFLVTWTRTTPLAEGSAEAKPGFAVTSQVHNVFLRPPAKMAVPSRASRTPEGRSCAHATASAGRDGEARRHCDATPTTSLGSPAAREAKWEWCGSPPGNPRDLSCSVLGLQAVRARAFPHAENDPTVSTRVLFSSLSLFFCFLFSAPNSKAGGSGMER